MRSLSHFIVLGVSFLFSGFAFSQVKSQKQPDYFVSTALHTGVSQFQDIQVPANNRVGSRADGTPIGPENATHLGFPVGGDLKLKFNAGNWNYGAGLGLIHMTSMEGPAETASSTYLRYNLELEGGYRFRDLLAAPGFFSRVEVRRSAFMNISSGHYIDMALVRLGGEVTIMPGWDVEASYALAPVTKFGYNAGGSQSNGAMKGSSAKSSEVALSSSYRVHKQSYLTFGLSQESSRVTIQDITAYNDYGLAVTTLRRTQSRVYNLNTRVIQIGLEKRF